MRGPSRRHVALVAVAVVAALTGGCGEGAAAGGAPPAATASAGGPSPAGTAVPDDPAAYAAEIVDGTNRARVDEGLPALAESACARDAALPRAEALVGTPGLEHAPMDDVLADCAPRTTAAENLSRAAATPAEVVDAWLDSYGHRENLLSPTLTDLGVACVRDDDAMLCSQIFLGP